MSKSHQCRLEGKRMGRHFRRKSQHGALPQACQKSGGRACGRSTVDPEEMGAEGGQQVRASLTTQTVTSLHFNLSRLCCYQTQQRKPRGEVAYGRSRKHARVREMRPLRLLTVVLNLAGRSLGWSAVRVEPAAPPHSAVISQGFSGVVFSS